MYVAEYLALQGQNVILMEKSTDFMLRASYSNQARAHNGYHYPRSMLTALRSRISFPKFCAEFEDCLDSSFEKIYLIGKLQSNVTPTQFSKFCERIGARCDANNGFLRDFTNPSLIEAAYTVDEVAFDACRLREDMRARLERAGVESRLSTEAVSVKREAGALLVRSRSRTQECMESYHQVFNCTYSSINQMARASNIPVIPLRHELAEICLVNLPSDIAHYGVTVMCGPFFSAMPFPSSGLASFSHVRYTPHCSWDDRKGEGGNEMIDSSQLGKLKRRSAWKHMQADAARYMPILSESAYVESLWEVKTILPGSEIDDSRPILFRVNHGMEGFHCVLGGKIDNVYDVISKIHQAGLDR